MLSSEPAWRACQYMFVYECIQYAGTHHAWNVREALLPLIYQTIRRNLVQKLKITNFAVQENRTDLVFRVELCDFHQYTYSYSKFYIIASLIKQSLHATDSMSMDQELDTKLQSAPATLSTMELKFCAIYGKHQNYIVKSRFHIDTSCLIATCNRHEHMGECLTKEDVSTTDASKIRKKSNCSASGCKNCVITGCV